MFPRCAIALFIATAHAQEPATFAIAGDWEVRVTLAHIASTTVRVTPPSMIEVTAERYGAIPLFRPNVGGWLKGVQLNGVKAQETTSPHLLDPKSFTLRAGPEADAPVFARGVDYEVDLEWGTFGRLAEGHIALDAVVFASYRHAQLRLDAIVLMPDGQIQLRPRAAAPAVPRLHEGERHLGNIYLPGFIAKLEPDHLFPILESAYPEPPISRSDTVSRQRGPVRQPFAG